MGSNLAQDLASDYKLRARPGTKAIWRQNARDRRAPLEAQCVQLFADMPPKCVELLAARRDDITALLDVAVYFDTPYCSLTVPTAIIRELSVRGMQFEIATYPCMEAGDVAAESAAD